MNTPQPISQIYETSWPGRPRAAAAVSITLALALVAFLLLPAAAPACEGHPPPPRCAKTLVLSQAGPSVILLPGGGTFDIPVNVYFALWDFPAGSGICPGGPYTVDISLTVTCSPAGDGGGMLMGAALSAGFNDFDISVTVPAGPPRLCTVDGTATVTLADGMELVAANDSLVCFAEPAPGDPTLPRLDLLFLGDPGDEIARVHPGDQATFTYRITNNDPAESFTGTIGVESKNSSRLPGVSGPMPAGTGPFSISDPGLGDNFPIGFPDDLVGGCLPLPPDPTLPVIPLLEAPILLPPGGFVDVPIIGRSWGMCADGSCSVAKVTVDGTFSDTSPGKACSGFVNAADIGAPPSYGWPDSGQTAFFPPPLDPALGILPLQGQPLPMFPVQIDLLTLQPQLAIDGNPPLPIPPDFFSGPISPERGRTRVQFADPAGFNVDSFFDVTFELQVQPNPGGPPLETEVVGMELVAGAPTGISNTAPFGVGQVGIRQPGGTAFDAFLELTFQISGIAVDDLGDERQLQFTQVEMMPVGDGSRVAVHLAGSVGPGTGATVELLELWLDPRGYLAQEVFIPPQPLFMDGFESGDPAAWTLQLPLPE